MIRAHTITEMLRLFQTRTAAYQPVGLIPLAIETGDPQAAHANLAALRQQGRLVTGVLTRSTGTLFFLGTGEQYYSPALRANQLAQVLAKAGFGSIDDLLEFCGSLPADYEGDIPHMPAAGHPSSSYTYRGRGKDERLTQG